ncbi:MAG TPA: NADP-dependent phosphogluconate dehydrogenase [Gemmatimonadota bacterium]|nr:NADP-dependent phosphogluconate dehydrogenase [Gemmatimonadota bacterium]
MPEPALTRAAFGLIGIGTMGSNLALNFEDHGIPVAFWNREQDRTRAFAAAHPDRELVPTYTFEELVRSLERPRRILMMIPAGAPVDETLARLTPLLEPGDVAIDGGNSLFHDTRRRAAELAARGLHFFGIGISGGSEGARTGPSLMVGGPHEAYGILAPALEAIAARTETGPCVGWLGPDGAGHFVKMVHNGIEYADMQSIAEGYDLLGRGLGLDAERIAELFAEWNRGPLDSYLIEITVDILRVTDPDTGRPRVESILDEAEQKGTGRWTAVTALELGVPAPAIGAAVDARVVSSRREERLAVSGRIQGPPASGTADREAAASAVRDALIAARIAALGQGMDLIAAGSKEYGWGIDRAEVARVWTGGCIIRSRLLDPVRRAYLEEPGLPNVLLDAEVGSRIEACQSGMRRALAEAQARGLPAPVWSAALAWFDAFRSARLPQNLTQAQRDYFGGHGYRLVSSPRGPVTHADWTRVTTEAGQSP